MVAVNSRMKSNTSAEGTSLVVTSVLMAPPWKRATSVRRCAVRKGRLPDTSSTHRDVQVVDDVRAGGSRRADLGRTGGDRPELPPDPTVRGRQGHRRAEGLAGHGRRRPRGAG